MIFYPLSTLINSGIKNILIITTKDDQDLFQRLLKDGTQWGVKIDYAIQDKPDGIAQALVIAKEWLSGSSTILILGDNLFFGPKINSMIKDSLKNNIGATIFGFKVKDPHRYGVIEFDNDSKVISIEEKPKKPKSDWAVTGLYIYDSNASDFTNSISKSGRGEYEITDLNNIYLKNDNLQAVLLDENYYWLDTGTHDSLLEASNIVKNIQVNMDQNIINYL